MTDHQTVLRIPATDEYVFQRYACAALVFVWNEGSRLFLEPCERMPRRKIGEDRWNPDHRVAGGG